MENDFSIWEMPRRALRQLDKKPTYIELSSSDTDENESTHSNSTNTHYDSVTSQDSLLEDEESSVDSELGKDSKQNATERGKSRNNADSEVTSEADVRINTSIVETEVLHGIDKEVYHTQHTDATSSVAEMTMEQESILEEPPCMIARRLFHAMKNYKRIPKRRVTKLQETLFLVMEKCNITSLHSEITSMFFLELERANPCFNDKVVLHLKRFLGSRIKERKMQDHKDMDSDINTSHDQVDKYSLVLPTMANSDHIKKSHNTAADMDASEPDMIMVVPQAVVQQVGVHGLNTTLINSVVQRKRGRPRKHYPNQTCNIIKSVNLSNKNQSAKKDAIYKCKYGRNSLEDRSVQAHRLVNAMLHYKFYSTNPGYAEQFKCKVRLDQERILYQIMNKCSLTGLDAKVPDEFFTELRQTNKYFSEKVVMRMEKLIRKKSEKKSVDLKQTLYPLIVAKPSVNTSDLATVLPMNKTPMFKQPICQLHTNIPESKQANENTKKTKDKIKTKDIIKTKLPQLSVRLTRVDQLLNIGKYSAEMQDKHISIKLSDYFAEPHNSSDSCKMSRIRKCHSTVKNQIETVSLDMCSIMASCKETDLVKRPDIDLTMDDMNTIESCDTNTETVSEKSKPLAALHSQFVIEKEHIRDSVDQVCNRSQSCIVEEKETGDTCYSGHWYLQPSSELADSKNQLHAVTIASEHEVQHTDKNNLLCEAGNMVVHARGMLNVLKDATAEYSGDVLHKSTEKSTVYNGESFRPFAIGQNHNIDNCTEADTPTSPDVICIEDSETTHTVSTYSHTSRQCIVDDSSTVAAEYQELPQTVISSSTHTPAEKHSDVHQKVTNVETVTLDSDAEECEKSDNPDVICVEDSVFTHIPTTASQNDKHCTAGTSISIDAKTCQEVSHTTTPADNSSTNKKFEAINQVNCNLCGQKLVINLYDYHLLVQHSKWIYDQVFGKSYFEPYDSKFDPKKMTFELPSVCASTVNNDGVALASTMCGIHKVPGWMMNTETMFIDNGKVCYRGQIVQKKRLGIHDIRTFRVECALCRAVIHETNMYGHLLKFHSLWIQDKIEEATKAGTDNNKLHFKLPEVLVTMLTSDGSLMAIKCDVKDVDNIVAKHNSYAVTENVNDVTTDHPAQNIQNESHMAAGNSNEVKEATEMNDKDNEANLSKQMDGQRVNTSISESDMEATLSSFSSTKCYLCHGKVPSGCLWFHIVSHHVEWKKMVDCRKIANMSKLEYFCTHCLAQSHQSFNDLMEVYAHEINVHGCSYSCFTCGSTFQTQQAYAHHAVKMHSMLYVCKKCPRNFAGLELLQSHTYERHPEVSLSISQLIYKVICPHCDVCFDRRQQPNAIYDMEQHITVDHMRYTNLVSSKSNHQCFACKQNFASKAALERHQSPKAWVIDTKKSLYFFNPNPKFDVHDNSLHNQEPIIVSGSTVVKKADGTIDVTNSVTGITYNVPDVNSAQVTLKNLYLLEEVTERMNRYASGTFTFRQLAAEKIKILSFIPEGLVASSPTIQVPELMNSNVKQTVSSAQVYRPAHMGSSQPIFVPALGQPVFMPGLGQSSFVCGIRQSSFVPISGNNLPVILATNQNASTSVPPTTTQSEASLPLNVNSSVVLPTTVVNYLPSIPVETPNAPLLPVTKMSLVTTVPDDVTHTQAVQLNQGNAITNTSSRTINQTHNPILPIRIVNTSSSSQPYEDLALNRKGITKIATSGGANLTGSQVVHDNDGAESGKKTSNFKTIQIPVMSGIMACTTSSSTLSVQSDIQLANQAKCLNISTGLKQISPSEEVSKEFREMELKAMQRGYFSDEETKLEKKLEEDNKVKPATNAANSDNSRLENLKSALIIKKEICEMKKSGLFCSNEAYTSHMQSLLDFFRKELDQHAGNDKGKTCGTKSAIVEDESERNETISEKIEQNPDNAPLLVSEPCAVTPYDRKGDIPSGTAQSILSSSSMRVNYSSTKTAKDVGAIQPIGHMTSDKLAGITGQPTQGNTIIINNQQGGSNTIILGNSVASCPAPAPTVIPVQSVITPLQAPQQVPVPIVMNGKILAFCQFPSNVTPVAQATSMYTGIQQSICAETNLTEHLANQAGAATPINDNSDTAKGDKNNITTTSYSDLLKDIVTHINQNPTETGPDWTNCVKTKFRSLQPAPFLNEDTTTVTTPNDKPSKVQHIPILLRKASTTYTEKSVNVTDDNKMFVEANSSANTDTDPTKLRSFSEKVKRAAELKTVKSMTWAGDSCSYYKRKRPSWLTRRKSFMKRGRPSEPDKPWKYHSRYPDSMLTKHQQYKSNVKTPTSTDNLQELLEHESEFNFEPDTCRRLLRKRKITNYLDPESDSSDTDDGDEFEMESETNCPKSAEEAFPLSSFESEHGEGNDISDTEQLSSEVSQSELCLCIQDIRSEAFEEYESVPADSDINVEPIEQLQPTISCTNTADGNRCSNYGMNSQESSLAEIVKFTSNKNDLNVKTVSKECQKSLPASMSSSDTTSIKAEQGDHYLDPIQQARVPHDEQQSWEILSKQDKEHLNDSPGSNTNIELKGAKPSNLPANKTILHMLRKELKGAKSINLPANKSILHILRNKSLAEMKRSDVITGKCNERPMEDSSSYNAHIEHTTLKPSTLSVNKSILPDNLHRKTHLTNVCPWKVNRQRKKRSTYKKKMGSFPAILPKDDTLKLGKGLHQSTSSVQPGIMAGRLGLIPTSIPSGNLAGGLGLIPTSIQSGNIAGRLGLTPTSIQSGNIAGRLGQIPSSVQLQTVGPVNIVPPAEKIQIKSEPEATGTGEADIELNRTKTGVPAPNETDITSTSQAVVVAQQNMLQQPVILQQPSLASSVASPLLQSGSQTSLIQQPLIVQQQGNFIQTGQSQLQQLNFISAAPQNPSVFVQANQLSISNQPNIKKAKSTAQPVFNKKNERKQASLITSEPKQSQLNASPIQSVSPAQPRFVQVQQGNALLPMMQNQPVFIQSNQAQQANIIQASQANKQLLLIQSPPTQSNRTQSHANQLILAPQKQLTPKDIKQEPTLVKTPTNQKSKRRDNQQQQSQFVKTIPVQQGNVIQLNQTQSAPFTFVPAQTNQQQKQPKMKITVKPEPIQTNSSNPGIMAPSSNNSTFQILQPSQMATVGQQQMFMPGSIVIQQGGGLQPNILQQTVVAQQPQFIQNIPCGQVIQQPQMMSMSMPQMFNIVNTGTQQLVLNSTGGQLQMCNTLPTVPVSQTPIKSQVPTGKCEISRNTQQKFK